MPSNFDVIYKLSPAIYWDSSMNWNHLVYSCSQQPSFSAAVRSLPFISWEQVGLVLQVCMTDLVRQTSSLSARTGEHYFALIKAVLKAGR